MPEYRKKIAFIPKLYKFMYEQTKDEVDIYYTNILKDNIYAQKMFEKQRKNMPKYNRNGEYNVYCFTNKKNVKINCSVEQGLSDKLKEFYGENLKKYDFSPFCDCLNNLDPNCFFSIQNKDGEIIANCALWDTTKTKQYVRI